MKNGLLMTFVMTIILFSCRKDSSFEELNESVTTVNTTINYLTTEGEIAGIVYDEENQAISNATININGSLQSTDENGAFYFPDAPLSESGTYIKAEKDGYILGSDFIYPEAGLNKSYIQMMQLSQDISFQADAGGTIQIERGGSVDFNPNAITSANGATYTGKVNVTAKRLATDDPNLEDKMPGELIGRNAENQPVVLATLGMVAIELRGENGEELNLKEGNKASITFPIADQDQAFAPDQIPLWYFDETQGMWLEEGSAIRVGNNYVGEVAHFSFWNCDAPFPLIHLCVNILNDDGTPADDVTVKICTNGLGTRGGRPQRGVLNGKVPQNEILEIKIFGTSGCGDLLYQQEIGPFTDDVKLDPIQLQNGEKFTVNGLVECSGNLVADAQVIIQGINFFDIVQANENGRFNYSTCSNSPIQLYAKNVLTGEASRTQEVSFTDASPELDLFFETCDECSFEVEVVIVNLLACDEIVEATAIVSNNDTYTYTWSDGNTGETVQVTEGEHTVTVTQNGTECEKVFAFTAPTDVSYLDLSFDTDITNCNTGFGGLTAVVLNGVSPYNYEWSNETGQSIGTNQSISEIVPGTYLITITDATGCTISSNVILEPSVLDIGIDIQSDYLVTCDQPTEVISIDNQNGTLNFEWIGPNGFLSNSSTVELENSGIYQLTITDLNGCEEQLTLIIVEDFEEPYIGSEITCDGIVRNLEMNSSSSGDIGIEIYTSNGIFILEGIEQNYTYSIFDFQPGSSFTITATDFSNGCFSQAQVEDGFVTENSIEVTSTTAPSCYTCTDGKIEANIIEPAECAGCAIEIYTQANQEYILMTEENDNNQLGVGTYYVSLKDETGCVTEFLTVEL